MQYFGIGYVVTVDDNPSISVLARVRVCLRDPYTVVSYFALLYVLGFITGARICPVCVCALAVCGITNLCRIHKFFHLYYDFWFYVYIFEHTERVLLIHVVVLRTVFIIIVL